MANLEITHASDDPLQDELRASQKKATTVHYLNNVTRVNFNNRIFVKISNVTPHEYE